MTVAHFIRSLTGATLISIALPNVSPAQAFEGVISMRMTGSGRAAGMIQEAQYFASRSGKARVGLTTPMGPAAIIMSPADKKMFLLIDQQSSYIEQNLDNLTGTPVAGDPAKVVRTGKKETIAGMECEHIKVDELDICAAKGLGQYLNFGGNMMGGGGMLPWQNAMLKEGVFPLRVTLPDGTVQLEVLKIERKAVEPAMFQVPDNYTKIQLPGRGG